MRPSSLTSVGHVPHGVLEGPDDGVQHQFELGRGDGEECREAVRVDSLEQVEEVGPVLWKFLKVLGDKQNTVVLVWYIYFEQNFTPISYMWFSRLVCFRCTIQVLGWGQTHSSTMHVLSQVPTSSFIRP